MRLGPALWHAVFALVVTAWISVLVTPEYGLPWLIAGCVILGCAYVARGRWLEGSFGMRVWRGAAALTLLGLIPDTLFPYPSVIRPAVHVALIAEALLLFAPPTVRTQRMLILLSLLNILATTIMQATILFAPLFLLYTICAVVALTFLYLAQQSGLTTIQLQRDSPTVRLHQTRPLVRLMAAGALTIVPSIIVFFLVMPRTQFSLVGRQPGDSDIVDALERLQQARRQTGFSDEISLGSYGRVQEDPTVVMRVSFPNGQPEDVAVENLYWRAGAVNMYDGYQWEAGFPVFDGRIWRTEQTRFRYFGGLPTEDNGAQVAVLGATGRGFIRPVLENVYLLDRHLQGKTIYDVQELRDDPELLEYEVFLELPYADNLIAMPNAVAVQGEFTPQGLSRDVNTGYRIQQRQALTERVSYTGFSKPQLNGIAALQGVPMTVYDDLEDWLRRLLFSYHGQLPTDLSPEVRQLVAQLVEGEDTLAGRVDKIQNHLLGMDYTLNIRQPTITIAPMDYFLFVAQEGYCEHFATAAVVMLREAGVPARLANGFKGGVWSDLGSYVAVRNADAHTWVEIWVPERGWIAIDPTPGNEPYSVPALNTYQLYAQSAWQQNVVGYNTTVTDRAYEAAAEWVSERPESIVAWFGSIAGRIGKALSWLANILLESAIYVAPLAFVIVVFVYVVREFILNTIPMRLPGRRAPVIPFYQRMLRSLARSGFERGEADAPRQFADRVSSARPDLANEVWELTRLYEQVRFGDRKLSADENAKIRQTLKTVSRKKRPSVSQPE